jgi:polysaccharide biosynthesis protein PslG
VICPNGGSLAGLAETGPQPSGDQGLDLNPWGAASGAEAFAAYPAVMPQLKAAGVRWFRGFYEWQTIQRARGSWDFSLPDRLLRNAKDNGIQLSSVLGYLAPWASADGGSRKFPIKDIQFWRDYVAGMVQRYHSDIKYWEVWNEFDGGFAENGTPEIYAELVREASVAAKRIDPSVQIGLSVANFDVRFLEATIKAGAANHFDYICIHPYEVLGRLSDGGEPAFLNMTSTLRQMLEATHQPRDVPLWITEIGSAAPSKADAVLDQVQASMLAKAYVLAIAAGFKRIFWFEAQGPSNSSNTDLGLLRPDMTPRPSYDALKTLTSTLGSRPDPAGWLDLGQGTYGFVFETEGASVLAAWAANANVGSVVTFDSDVRVSSVTGQPARLVAGTPIRLSSMPVLITDLPSDLIKKAKAQRLQPYPWSISYAETNSVDANLSASNVEKGIQQIHLDTTIADGEWRRTNFSRPDGEGHYVYFWISPQFAGFGSKKFEVTAAVQRVASNRVAGMNLDYESDHGYASADYHSIPEGGGWQHVSWTITDANFVGAWGWNIRLNGIASPNDFLIKGIKVQRIQ